MIRSLRLATSSVNRFPEIPQLNGGQRRFELAGLRMNPAVLGCCRTDATSNAGSASVCAFAGRIKSDAIKPNMPAVRSGFFPTFSLSTMLPRFGELPLIDARDQQSGDIAGRRCSQSYLSCYMMLYTGIYRPPPRAR